MRLARRPALVPGSHDSARERERERERETKRGRRRDTEREHLYAVGAIARSEQASHEDRSPHPGKNSFIKRCVVKKPHVDWEY